MQLLKHAIYKHHLQRERARQEPVCDPAEETYCHGTDEERDHLGGFDDPKNTVAITVHIANEYGEEYGSRVQLISPQEAGRRIDGDRETILHLRESLTEQRFWRRFMTRVAWIAIILNMFFIALLIGG